MSSADDPVAGNGLASAVPQASASKPTDVQLGLASDLNRWRIFIAIAELGSLTKAAFFLDSNQSLLSRQVGALERECGARLFVRTGRGVELSEVGQRLLPQVRTLLCSAKTLEEDILSNVYEPTGRVTLGLLPSIGSTLVNHLLPYLRSRYPSISLRVLEGSSGQVEEWLGDARVDIAVLYRYGTSLPEQEQSLATVDSYLIGRRGDPVTAALQVPFRVLDGLPLVLPSSPNGLRTALDATARQQHMSLSTVVEADSLPLLKRLSAEQGLFTVLPLHAVWDEVRSGSLQAAQLFDPPMQRTVAMAFAKVKGPSRAVVAVATHIRRTVEEMTTSGMWRRPA